ncbi:carbohydrate ABC transporter permease [Streptomyces sp. NBC_00988]|uniref:carbohydrate ABC transporter permease n=1 Tax=Streptomyces sp. NBC_00988 TaxID=2903704 RepID=UPI00386367A6|nr:carbohydrate ABC transporter permease [Streptomyces sp. NBC_00988]
MTVLPTRPRPRRSLLDSPGALVRDLLLTAAGTVFLVPVLWLVLAPTKTEDQIRDDFPFAVGSPSNVLTAWNNLYAFNDGEVVRWIVNSVLYSVSSVTLTLVLCVTAGYGMAKYLFVGRKTLLITTLVAMIIPTAATILPLYVELAAVHLTGTALSVILPLAFYPWGVYLAYTYFTSSLPESLMEAARMDGASETRIFLRIALPLAKPLIALITFFGFVSSWTNFMLPYLMLGDTGDYPLPLGLAVLPLANVVSGNPNFSTVEIGLPEAALAGVLSVLPILLMFLFAQRYLTSAQLAGSEKG